MSLQGIRTQIDNALAGIQGLNHSTVMPPAFTVPVAFPALNPTNAASYDLTAGNAALVYHFYIEVIVNKGISLEQAQDELDPYLHPSGEQSIKQAIEGIDAPNDDFDVCRVMNVSNYGAATYGGTEYLGVRFLVDFWTSN